MENNLMEAQEQLLAQFEKGTNVVLSTSADNVVTKNSFCHFFRKFTVHDVD